MWIFTKKGFYSVVQHMNDPETLLVRGRVRADLAILAEDLGLDPDKEILEWVGTDYPYRLLLTRNQVAGWLGATVGELDYGNFKSEVLRLQGQVRELIYLRVWTIMRTLEKLL